MTTVLKHHEFKAELIEDEHGPAVMLEQSEGWDEPSVVLIHPHQLREVCERFGLAGEEKQAKEIATLRRRMLALQSRIDDLHYYMAHHSDHKHADLSYELTCLTALADMAEEWCADFDGAQTRAPLPECAPSQTTSCSQEPSMQPVQQVQLI